MEENRPATDAAAEAAFADAVTDLAAETERAGVLARALEGAEVVLGARGGAVILRDTSLRIAHHRGLDPERLRQAAADPSFRATLERSTPELLGPTHPLTQLLDADAAVFAVVPLQSGGRQLGHLLLALARRPDAAAGARLRAYASQVALAVDAAALRRRLAEHADRFSSTVHAVPNPVVVVDGRGLILVANAAAAITFGLAGRLEEGQPVGSRLGPDLAALLLRDEDVTVEVVAGDPPRLHRATTRAVRAASGVAIGRVLVLDDLTVEREADRLKADFVAVVGHELRTPLTVIRGYAQALVAKWRVLDDQRREQAVNGIDGAARRLERLVEGILFVSAIEDRRPPLDLNREDIGGLLDAFADDRVSVSRPAGELWRIVDRSMLEAVLHQLVENARKYSEGPVEIQLTLRDNELEVTVLDEGPGIYSGDLPLLFHRFSQLDSTSTRKHGGMGIGLYISRRLVEGMGGRIWCESRLTVGSRFAFVVPAEPA